MSEDNKMTPGIGHNSERMSFDEMAREIIANGYTGMVVAQRDVVMAAGEDPRMRRRHRVMLNAIIRRMNPQTGTAWPGHDVLTADISKVAITREGRYTKDGAQKTLSEMIEWGYLLTARRAPPGYKRALANYTIHKPTQEELQAEITKAVEALRSNLRRGKPDIQGCLDLGEPPIESTSAGRDRNTNDTTHGGRLRLVSGGTEVGSAKSLSSGEKIQVGAADPTYPAKADPTTGVAADPTTGMAADPTPGDRTVSNKDESLSKKEGRQGQTSDGVASAAKPPADAGSMPDAWIGVEFEVFWKAFPPGRKVGKLDALDTFKRIVTGKHKTRKATARQLIEAAERFAASKPNPDYTPMPTTWLNQGRWQDDLDQSQALRTTTAAPSRSKGSQAESLAKLLRGEL